MRKLELGLDTFGDVTVDDDGTVLPQPRVIRNVIDEAVLADQPGGDFIGGGEHDRPDLATSAPEDLAGASAARTTQSRPRTAATPARRDVPRRANQRVPH